MVIISWIDDNMIVGSKAAVLEAKQAMMERFKCDDCGEIMLAARSCKMGGS